MIDFGQDQTVEALGQVFRLSRMKLRFVRPLKDYVRAQVGNPYDDLKGVIGELPPELAREELKRAADLKEQLACFSLQCPLAQKFLTADGGALAVLVKAMLADAHPGVTDDQAQAVLEALQAREEGVAGALARAEGDGAKNSSCPAG